MKYNPFGYMEGKANLFQKYLLFFLLNSKYRNEPFITQKQHQSGFQIGILPINYIHYVFIIS